MGKIYKFNSIYDGLGVVFLAYLENFTRVKTRVKLVFNLIKTAKYRAINTTCENA